MNNKIFTFYKKNAFSKRKKAFTVAELLLTLTAIGIIAAIVMPATMLNINNKVFETQKEGIYTRFSQSIPKLTKIDGYGELVGNLSNCASTSTCVDESAFKDTAAKTFVHDGLAKVMKIKSICDSDNLSDCNLPDTMTAMDGTTAVSLSSIKTLADYNSFFDGQITASNKTYEQLNTKAAAFETENGEGILVYYNPYCSRNDTVESGNHFPHPKLCANFVYDLNGRKGPNMAGKDIGFISVIYPRKPIVVSVIPNSTPTTTTFTYDNAFIECKNINENMTVPNLNELNLIFYNKKLIGGPNNGYWASDTVATDLTKGWAQTFVTSRNFIKPKTETYRVWCVKRMFE